jgi:hypothetical protein
VTHLQFAPDSLTTPCGRIRQAEGGTAERITPYLADVDCPECLRWVQEWRRPTWWTELPSHREFVSRRPDHAHDRLAVSQ